MPGARWVPPSPEDRARVERVCERLEHMLGVMPGVIGFQREVGGALVVCLPLNLAEAIVDALAPSAE